MRLSFAFLFLFLTPFLSHAGNSCEEIFYSSEIQIKSGHYTLASNKFEKDFLWLQKELERQNVLRGSDVDQLNTHFNDWVKLTDLKFSLIEKAMASTTLNKIERLNTLELIQSIYRSYFNVINPIYSNIKWRRSLNHADKDRPHNSFQILQGTVFSKDLFDFYKDLVERETNLSESTQPKYYSPRELDQVLTRLKYKGKVVNFRDRIRKGIENTIHVLTEAIGITSDTFPLRAGKMMNRPEVIQDFVQNLQPMDLLLDRAVGFKLSHRIIPGYYGHTGMYLGTKEQLIELGMWDDPLIVPLQRQIEQGNTMLEAKRTGIFLRKLSDYMNTDSITAIRQKNKTDEGVRSKIRWGLNQIGKHFDHTFDLEHSESFFCSKLVYYVFQDVPWPTKYAFGRNSIPPDFVASMALGKDRHFDPVLVYENGIKIEGDLQNHVERVQGSKK